MKEELKHTKWYWFVPLVWLVICHKKENLGWCFEPKRYSARIARNNILYIIMLINLLSLLILWKVSELIIG